MITESHIWVARTKCTCGYVWTTPGSPNVVCACGQTHIIDNAVVSGGGEVTSEEDFKAAVAAELSVSPDELALIKG